MVGFNERREAVATFERARELFDRADEDEDGLLDRYEIVGLVQSLWGELGIAEGFQDEERLEQEVDEAMEHFGDPEGGVKFAQFVRMLTKPPWRSLMPESTQEVLPHLLLKEARGAAQEEEKEDQEESGLSVARQMFIDADVDQDGHLDEDELRDVVDEWILHCDEGNEPKLQPEQVDEHLATLFGDAGDGYIDVDQWIAMLAIEPWKALLPPKLRDEIMLGAAMVKADAHPYSRIRTMPPQAAPKPEVEKAPKKAPLETPGERAFRMARQLFEEADEDSSGFVDSEELTSLVSKLYGKLNIKVTPEMTATFDQAVIDAMSLHPDGIYFPEFIKLLGKEPWRDVIPEEIKASLPKVLMKLIKSEEGEEMMSQMSGSKAGSVTGSAKKSKPAASSQIAKQKKSPSERKAAPVRKCFPASQQHLPDAVHAIRQIFMSADANEDGYLNGADMELLARQVWELTDTPPANSEQALQQIMSRYGDHQGLVTLDKFTTLVSSTDWRELLPEVEQATLSRALADHTHTPQVPVSRFSHSSSLRTINQDLCYGTPPSPSRTHTSIAFQQVRQGAIPVKTIRTGTDAVAAAHAQLAASEANTSPAKQQYPMSPSLPSVRASPKKQELRTGVQFRRAPKNQLNAFGQRKPNQKSNNTYKALIDEASKTSGGAEPVDSMDGFMKVANKMFTVLDTDKSGSINQGELSLGMQHIWGELGVASLLATPLRCNDEAKRMVSQFGDAEGEVSFVNFLRVLLQEPWKNLLPPVVLEKANFNIMKMLSKQEPPTLLTEALRKMRMLFEDIDTDSDGLLSYDEFEVLMYAVWEELGVSPANKEHLHERAALRVFGKDAGNVKSMTIDLGTFIGIMCDSPWVNQLRRDIRDDLMLEGMRRKAEYSEASGAEEASEAADAADSLLVTQDVQQAPKAGRPIKWLHSRTVADLANDKYKGPRSSRPSVLVFPNDGGKKKKGVKVLVYSFDALLHDVTVALDVGYSMTRVFTMNGKEIKTLSQVTDGMKLIVSPWGDFKARGGDALDAVARKRIGSSPTKKSSSPFMPCNRSSPFKKATTSYTGRVPSKDEAFLQALQGSPTTVGEPVIDSILNKMRQYYLPDQAN